MRGGVVGDAADPSNSRQRFATGWRRPLLPCGDYGSQDFLLFALWHFEMVDRGGDLGEAPSAVQSWKGFRPSER
jgi:hypothetical protein